MAKLTFDYKPTERNQNRGYAFTYNEDGETGSGIKKGDTFYQTAGYSNFGQGGTPVMDSNGNQVYRDFSGYAGPRNQYGDSDTTKAPYNYGYTMGDNAYTARNPDGTERRVTFDYIKNGKGAAGRSYDTAFMSGLMSGMGAGMMNKKQRENDKKRMQRDAEMKQQRAENDFRRSEAAAQGRGEYPNEMSGQGSFGDSYNDYIDSSMAGDASPLGGDMMGGMDAGGGGGMMDSGALDMAGAGEWGGAWSSKSLKTGKKSAGDMRAGIRKIGSARGQDDSNPAAQIVRQIITTLRGIDQRVSKLGG